eukprot:3286162-Pleurochrysis_carterae.AAC.2
MAHDQRYARNIQGIKPALLYNLRVKLAAQCARYPTWNSKRGSLLQVRLPLRQIGTEKVFHVGLAPMLM